jgi:hypothetical protein
MIFKSKRFVCETDHQSKGFLMELIEKDGFNFRFDSSRCKECEGYCCRGESGYIWVTPHEIFQIGSFLEINTIDFIQTYLRRIDGRFSIKERFTGQDLECVFFEDAQKQCAIYPVRPFQCRQYPFWEHLKEQKGPIISECPGIIQKCLA